MFFAYFYEDLDKCPLEYGGYYTLEDLKANVVLFAQAEAEIPEGGWFVYKPNGYSWDPLPCENTEEAYEALLEELNTSLYEKYFDL